jgi:alkylated DNA repair dioxygenase AlkB
VGFLYAPEFITADEERLLLDHINALDFHEVVMHGVAARRTVVHFGYDYAYDQKAIMPTEDLPDWLMPFRDRCAALAEIEKERLEAVLIARYPPGATIGWHRDAPMFGSKVMGISLGAEGLMRYRRTKDGVNEIFKIILEPRSAYVISGAARASWQHSLAPTKDMRYSITFRTVRSGFKAVPPAAG